MSSTKPDVLDETFGEGVVSPISKDVLESFFLSSKDANRSVCIITSGGTQVPLETRMVRSIENFSTGRRGACMVEALLDSSIESEYSVLLLMRTGTTLPFARNFTISTVSDAVQFKSCANGVRLHSPIAKAACTQLNQVLQQNRLLIVEYTTVEQYLLGLRLIANKSTVLGARVLFCLAAAVSDYYVPSCERNTHKMESTGDVLTLKLHKVPKCLGYLKSEWAPLSFVASFKVSDIQILSGMTNIYQPKARNR